MEATPAQAIKYFNGFHQYMIPLFQRPYEWKRDQWTTLWEDLLEQYESDRDTTHFMGAIVTMPTRSVPVGVSKFLVIDGQQRLTTLSILLCAIKASIGDENDAAWRRIQNHYLTNEGSEDYELLKLLPTQIDRQAFRRLVAVGEAGEDGNVGDAFEYFVGKIADKDGNGDPIEPRKLLETVESKLMVVSINLSDTDDPYLIFESLNFKGSPLTQADLVRNYFLMRFPVNEQQAIYDELWYPMQERLGEHLTEFMRAYLMTYGEEVRKGDIYSSLKRRLAAMDGVLVREELARMSRFSAHYIRFVRPDQEPDSELRAQLDRMQRWEVGVAFPTMLLLYEFHAAGQMDIGGLRDCLALIESFVVRRTFCLVPSNQLTKMFVSWSKELQTTDVADLPIWLLTTMAAGDGNRRWPRDPEFASYWQTFPIYQHRQGSRCRVVLERLEGSFEHREPAQLQNATIEHVMPQTLTEHWKVELGEAWEAVSAKYLHSIGNLTLSGYNDELGNLSFSEKKDLLSSSNICLNGYFPSVARWDEAAITERADALFGVARNLWMGPE